MNVTLLLPKTETRRRGVGEPVKVEVDGAVHFPRDHEARAHQSQWRRTTMRIEERRSPSASPPARARRPHVHEACKRAPHAPRERGQVVVFFALLLPLILAISAWSSVLATGSSTGSICRPKRTQAPSPAAASFDSPVRRRRRHRPADRRTARTMRAVRADARGVNPQVGGVDARSSTRC